MRLLSLFAVAAVLATGAAAATGSSVCNKLKSDDGCGLATKNGVAAAINAYTRPIYQQFWVDFNDQMSQSCTAVPTRPPNGDPEIDVGCSRLADGGGDDDWVHVIRICPVDEDGVQTIAIQGSCEMYNENTPGDERTGYYWPIPGASYDVEYTSVSCAFKPSQIPASIKNGRIYASATCVRAGVRAVGTAPRAPAPKTVGGMQVAGV
jgi:hypothetical protein